MSKRHRHAKARRLEFSKPFSRRRLRKACDRIANNEKLFNSFMKYMSATDEELAS